MGKAYSLDFRKKVVKAYQSGLTQEEVAERYDICRKTLCSWLARLRGGILAPKPRGKGEPYKIDAAKAARLIKETPEMTLQEMADRLGVTAQAVWHHWTRSGITRKKKDALPRAGREGKGGVRGKDQGRPPVQDNLRRRKRH